MIFVEKMFHCKFLLFTLNIFIYLINDTDMEQIVDKNRPFFA